MKTYNFNGDIAVVNLGDLHLGSSFCDVSGVDKAIDYILKNENVYWVSTGDILDINLKQSKTFDYGGMSVGKEIEMAVKMLEPIKQKCLGVVGSNHHYRVEKEIGLNIDNMLCKMLGIPYLGYTGFLRLIVEGCGHFVCLHHTNGFGRTRGAKANSAERLSDVYRGYDVYMTGHTHCYQHLIDKINILDRKHYTNMLVTTHIVTTGHYLNYSGSYAERMLLTPAPKGSSIVYMNKSKQIKANFLEV
jgi:hypothetical protein